MFAIGTRKAGLGQFVYFIAEIAANHCHDLGRAAGPVRRTEP